MLTVRGKMKERTRKLFGNLDWTNNSRLAFRMKETDWLFRGITSRGRLVDSNSGRFPVREQ